MDDFYGTSMSGNFHITSHFIAGKRMLWRITMLLMGKLTISMAMFNSYVELPEGTILGAKHPTKVGEQSLIILLAAG